MFAKLPRTDNPVHLIDNVSSLLAHEDEAHTPAGDILAHTLDLRYRFNAGLMEPGYELPQEVLDGVAENDEQTRRLVDSYVERTNAVTDMFSRVTTGSDSDRLVAFAEIEAEIANPGNVLRFYRSLDDCDLPPLTWLQKTGQRFGSTKPPFSSHYTQFIGIEARCHCRFPQENLSVLSMMYTITWHYA